jgi:nucleoside phosphorylase
MRRAQIMNNHTGIIIATRLEAEPFIRGLGLSSIEKKPFRVYGSESFTLAISDIGKSNAAMASAHLIGRYSPARIINPGAAGSAENNFKIGDILHIDKVYELDRPRLLSGKPVAHTPDTMKGFLLATLATQDRPVFDPAQRAAAAHYADLVDMEGAAVVQACRAYGSEAYLFKVVTDTPLSGKREIIPNMLATRNSLFEFFIERVVPLL